MNERRGMRKKKEREMLETGATFGKKQNMIHWKNELRCFCVIPENQGMENLLLVVRREHCIECISQGKVLNLMSKLVWFICL